MRVESLEAFPIRIKADENLQGGTFSYGYFQTVLVRATCDGVEGWGEAMTRSDPRATASLVRHLGVGIIGKEFADVADAWEDLWKGLRVRGHTRGVDVEALSGIEIGLQDCKGKLASKSIGSMFNEENAREVKVFAGSIFESRGPLEGQVQLARSSGMKGCKVKIGFGVERDLSILKEVRKGWPEGMLVADANGAYDGASAAKACKSFADLDLAWFEEPVLSDDWEGYRGLRGSGVRVGGGESWFVSDFEWALKEPLVDVVEPSVSRCGGMGTEMRVAKDASSRKIGFSPMTGMNSCISLAASLQVASAYPTIGVEFNPFVNPLQSDLAYGFGTPRDGAMEVPRGPGLGIEIDEKFVKDSAIQ